MPRRKTRQNMVSEVGYEPSTLPRCKGVAVSPPSNFNFQNPDWAKWVVRWERYRKAIFLDTMPDQYQINTLLYTMGDEVENLLIRLNLAHIENLSYVELIQHFDRHFNKTENLFFERTKFFQRVQSPGEPVQVFISDLHTMSVRCKFGELREDLVMHKIIQGLSNTALSEQFQTETKLTLRAVEERAQHIEAVKKQQQFLRSSSTYLGEAMQRERKHQMHQRQSMDQQKGYQRRQESGTCGKCGRSQHAKGSKCPAAAISCYICQDIGHFARFCPSRPVQTVVDGSSSDSDHVVSFHLNTVGRCGKSSWVVEISVGEVRLNFRVDTGADVSVIGEKYFSKAFKGLFKLEKTDTKLFGPGSNKLRVLGKFQTVMRFKNNVSPQEIYVIEGEQQPLLGRPAIEALKVVLFLGTITADQIKQEYPNLTRELGLLKGYKYKIVLDDKARPYAIKAPRRIPYALRDKTQIELKRLERLGVISPIEEPTDWVAGMVVVPKPNGEVRITVDYTQLNKSVRRERWILPSVDEVLHQVSRARYFSKIDFRNGYFQLELDPQSKQLTTFITPFGRFFYNRMPMGIASAPEVYHKRVIKELEGLKGVVTLLDDSLIFGNTREEHDVRLREVLGRLNRAGIVLNMEKCEFGVTSVSFLGHRISDRGIEMDHNKISAILKMPSPKNVTELRRLLGMFNYYLKFFPDFAKDAAPLRELLCKDREWFWDANLDQCLRNLKNRLISPPVLSFYDSQRPTRVLADASLEGLGAVLEQQSEGDGMWRPIEFASRRLSEAESRYSNIEREALGVTWACEKFRSYIVRLRFKIFTDHKPLVTLLGGKALDDLTPRIQRFRMRLLSFDYDIEHVSGKTFYVPDALSRSPLETTVGGSDILEERLVDLSVQSIQVPQVTDHRLRQLRDTQCADGTLVKIIDYVQNGWPAQVEIDVSPYKKHQNELWVRDEMLLYKNRIVIPRADRKEILVKIHEGHGGVKKCLSRAGVCVWWPGITRDIKDMVESCRECIKQRVIRPEPLISTPLPSRPWEMVAMDHFKFNGKWYLVVADYYSRYPEIGAVKNLSTGEVVRKFLKSLFAKFGVPEKLRCDGGTSFTSYELGTLGKELGFQVVTSSPKYPQSNGFIEAMVKVAKGIVSKGDIDLGLLAYRSTPLEQGYSPAELLMGRKLRGTLPILPGALLPCWPPHCIVKASNDHIKQRNKNCFDRRHGVRPLRALEEGEEVWIPDKKQYGKVLRQSTEAPRRYIVEGTSGGVYERNRRMLIPTSNSSKSREGLKGGDVVK